MWPKHEEWGVDFVNSSGEAARLMSEQCFDVVMSDMTMPEMTGVELLALAELNSPDTVRIMLTGNRDQKTARDAVNLGHVFRFLSKSCQPEEMIFALEAGIRQHQLLTAERELLEGPSTVE